MSTQKTSNLICKQLTTSDGRFITQILCFDKTSLGRQVDLAEISDDDVGKATRRLPVSLFMLIMAALRPLKFPPKPIFRSRSVVIIACLQNSSFFNYFALITFKITVGNFFFE